MTTNEFLNNVFTDEVRAYIVFQLLTVSGVTIDVENKTINMEEKTYSIDEIEQLIDSYKSTLTEYENNYKNDLTNELELPPDVTSMLVWVREQFDMLDVYKRMA